MSILNHDDLSVREHEAYAELDAIKQTLREYLRLGSCDGRVERKELRKQLAMLLGDEYDENEARLKH
jgi:hypothetical protein